MLVRIRNDIRIKMPTNEKTAVDFNAHFQGRVLFDSDGQPVEPRGRRAEPSIASQCTRRQAIKDAKEEADSIKASAPKGKGKGKIIIEVVSELEQEAPSPAESNEQQDPDAGAEPNGDLPQRGSRKNEKTLVAEAVLTTQGQKRKAQVEDPEDFQKPAKIKRWTTHEAVAEAKLARVRRRAAIGRSIADNPPAIEKPAVDRPITEQLAREEPLPEQPPAEESAVTILTVTAPTVQGPLDTLIEEPAAEEQPAPEEEPAVRKPTKKGAKAKETQTEAAEPAKKTRRRIEKKATAEPEKKTADVEQEPEAEEPKTKAPTKKGSKAKK